MGTSPSKRYSGSHLVTVKCYIQYLFLMVFYIQYISGSDVSFSSTIMEQLGSLVFLNHLVPNPGLGPLEREREGRWRMWEGRGLEKKETNTEPSGILHKRKKKGRKKISDIDKVRCSYALQVLYYCCTEFWYVSYLIDFSPPDFKHSNRNYLGLRVTVEKKMISIS